MSLLDNIGIKIGDLLNGAGNVIPPSVDGNIHPEVAAPVQGIPNYKPDSEIVSGLPPTSPKDLVKKDPPHHSPPSSSSPGHRGSTSAKELDYLNADLAKYYRMNRTTAYNEALSNTSYQRAVKDMQAAGLNPAVLFGNGRVSGSDGVYGAAPLSASRGRSGGGYSRHYGGSGRSGKLFSSDTYGMISGLGALIGAGISAATGHSAGLGAMAGSNIATSAAKVLNGLFGK